MIYRLRKSEDSRVRGHHVLSIDFCTRKHFSDLSFDAFKYKFHFSKFDELALAKRRDAHFYSSIALKYRSANDVIEYCLANVLSGAKHISSYTDVAMHELAGKWDILQRTFTADCNLIKTRSSLKHSLSSHDGSIPLIVSMMLQNIVSLETVAILQLLTGFASAANDQVKDTLLWPEVYLRIVKYSSYFREIDREIYRGIVISVFDIEA